MASDDWQPISLGDVVSIKHGWPFKSEYFSETLTGKPIVVSIGNFHYTGGFRFESTECSEYRDEYPAEYELAAGDILLIMTCQTPGGEILGVPGKIPNDGRVYLHNQRMGKVILKRPDLAVLDYLYWVFLWKEFNQELVASSTGTKIVHTAPNRIEAFKFMLPPIKEQLSIANVMNLLRDRIELNRQMSYTLQAMAQGIYRSWFVDFEPVAAKADGRKPYGLSDETAALFPAHYEESKLGLIPKGWHVSTVGAEFNIVMGQSPPGETYNEVRDGLPFYQGRTDFGFRYPGKRIYCSAPTRIASPGDTLVSVRAPVGDINMAFERCAIGRGVGAIRHKSSARSYSYYTMHGLKDAFDVFEGDGTLFGAINKDGFKELLVLAPPSEVLKKYEDIAKPIDDLIENNELEISTLTVLLDNMLPKLLSGEIRLKQAEKLVEEVA